MRKSLLISFSSLLVLAAWVPAEAGWEEGVAAFKARNYSQAAQEFQSVVEAQPDFAGGHYMLGQALLRQKQNAKALTALLKAYELESGNLSHQMALSQAYLANGRFGEAANLLRKINPSSLSKSQQVPYYEWYSVSLDKSGRTSEAVPVYKKVAELKGNDADAWYNYGTAAYNEGEMVAAMSALKKAVDLAPDAKKQRAFLNAVNRRARESRDSALYKQGLSVAQALVSTSGTYENLLLMAEIQLGAKEYRGAADTLTRAVAKNSGDFYGQFYLSQAYTALDSWTDADAAGRRAVSAAKSDADKKRAWRQIGFVNEKLKNFDEARAAYQNAGDQAAIERVDENQRIAKENLEAEKHNREVDELEAERRRLEQELKELGSAPPPR